MQAHVDAHPSLPGSLDREQLNPHYLRGRCCLSKGRILDPLPVEAGWEEVAAELSGWTIAHFVLLLGTAHDEDSSLTASSMWMHSGSKYKPTLFARPGKK
eukprot:1147317-Pelagomonas_calceolata.AAC.5